MPKKELFSKIHMRAHGLNPRIKKSPFFESTVASGATEFHPYNGMWMPVGYDTPVNEYWNTIKHATLWDVSVQRIVEISGDDASRFVNLLTPRDIDEVAVGQCRYIILTNQDGGILNDPVLLRLAQNRFWLSTADSDVYMWAKGVEVFAGMEVAIDTPEVYPLQLQGPASPRIMAEVFGDDILDLRYYRWTWSRVKDIDVAVSRTGYSAELGFEIYLLGRGQGAELWRTLLDAGKPFGLTPGSPNRIRRIEGGILDYGSDVLASDNPFEMGLERLFDLDTQSDFIGKAALRRIRREGIKRKLMGAFMSGAPFEKNNEHRWPVRHDNTVVGEVTSAVYSPRLERNIGYVLANIEYASVGTRLWVETPEGGRNLEVTTIPFIDPGKKIPRAKLR